MVSAVDGPHEAILIANGKYQNAPKLDNTANDARLLEVELKAKRFQVTTLIDLDFASMSLNLEAFAKRARNSAGVSIVYFAGHGVQLEGSNYILPTDADMSSKIALKNSAVDLGALLKSFGPVSGGKEQRLVVILLDACRDNPWSTSVGPGLGFPTFVPHTTIIGFATSPGKVALDGVPGGNGPYAKALAAVLQEEGNVKPHAIFYDVLLKKAGGRVAAATLALQTPWLFLSPRNWSSIKLRIDFSDCSSELRDAGKKQLDALGQAYSELTAQQRKDNIEGESLRLALQMRSDACSAEPLRRKLSNDRFQETRQYLAGRWGMAPDSIMERIGSETENIDFQDTNVIVTLIGFYK